ncbi:hypothetical protein [Mycobacterium kubicae]|uniref:hypothetical protein n=1 Tax=Mycobacterium kubicae TaxID=120959 RepID=UPI001FD57837|nr:hypothetical protein [Mycobacterium kubicae]
MQPSLRMDTASVQAMARRWNAFVAELTGTVKPSGLELSSQLNATAVDAVGKFVTAFTAGVAARVNLRATSVAHADTGYLANEALSAAGLAAVASPATSV